jgi:hypothetical protein
VDAANEALARDPANVNAQKIHLEAKIKLATERNASPNPNP